MVCQWAAPRTDGPAIVYAEGAGSAWYLNGELHRVDGPALEFATGAKSWYQKGQLHREDGPAVEGADGTREWHLRGIEVTEEQFNKTLESQPKIVTKTSINTRVVVNRMLALRNLFAEEGGSTSGVKPKR